MLALIGCSCGCCRGRDCSSGKKVCSVRIGFKRRVFRRSESVCRARVAIGDDGYVGDGTRIRDRKVR
jgi:hypothetical protein